MSLRATAFFAGLVFVLFDAHSAFAAEPPKESTKRAASARPNDSFHIGEMAQAAVDLRKAAEACERLVKSLGGMAETVAKSLAVMSSEFDPFGYKTAFRTVGRQTQIIQQQSELIQKLQQREIERLQRENTTLRKQLGRLRARNRGQSGER